jgi:hypothetical protein
MIETYEGIVWDIDEIPIASSTTDELFELDFRATGKCPECGGTINGTAHVWSRDENFIDAWLERVDFDECECNSEETEKEDYDDDEFDEEETTETNNQKSD